MQATWRMAADASSPGIRAGLARVAACLAAQLSEPGDGSPELMDGNAGAALALHTAGTGRAPEPCWDTFLALA